MVSPGKTRTSGFSNLREVSEDRSPTKSYGDANPTRVPRGRAESKYTANTDDEKRRLRRVIDHVKQSLEPFYRAGRSTAILTGGSSVPAAETIRKFVASTTSDQRSRRDVRQPVTTTIDLAAFRKCLYALGVASDDTAFLLESLDSHGTGEMDSKAFATMFLPVRPTLNGGSTGVRRRLSSGQSSSDENNDDSSEYETRTRAKQPQNAGQIEAFHRKVLERVVVKYANVKDAFRQYDTGRAGVLTLAQFRAFVRDLGFVGGDVDALFRHLDGDQQRSISFRAFAMASGGSGKLKGEHTYIPKQSPKRIAAVKPLAAARRRAPPTSMKTETESTEETDEIDPIESIRSKLRQRVIGRSKSIREVFLEFDADGNGHLDHAEFTQFMAAYHFSLDETRQTIAFLDKDGSGTIDYDEFASGLLFYRPVQKPSIQKPLQNIKKPHNEEERQLLHGEYLLSVVREKLEAVANENDDGLVSLRDEFLRFDADGSGALDYQEFAAFLVGLGIKLSPRDLDALMLVVDDDRSSEIEFEKFTSMFSTHGRVPIKQAVSPGHTRTRARPAGGDDDDVLTAVFRQYDVDDSGQLKAREFNELMRDHGFGDADIKQVLKELDSDGIGIDLETFQSAIQARGWKLSQPLPAANSSASTTTAEAKANDTDALAKRMLRDHASLDAAFREHDRDGNGELSHDEFRRSMKQYGVRDARELQQLIQTLDTNHSGTISIQQAVSHFQPHHTSKPPKDTAALRELKQVWVDEVLARHATLLDAFRAHDADGRGTFDYEAFRDLMGQYGITDDRNVRALLAQVDVNHSGTVSEVEFLAVFGGLAKPRARKLKAATHTKKTTAATPIQHQPVKGGLAAAQAATSAARLRLLEEQWIQNALATHGSVRAAFNHFDADASGELDHEEFTQLMSTFGITRSDDIASMVRRLDVDASGAIDYDEFATLFHEARVPNVASLKKPSLAPLQHRRERGNDGGSDAIVPKRRRDTHQAARMRDLELKWIKRALSCHTTIESAFTEYDRDGNGELDHEEFEHCMKRYGIVQSDDIARLVRRLDLDGSGTIDFHEFSTVFNPLRCRDVVVNPLAEDPLDDTDELQSILEIERELAERILQHTRDMRQAFRKFDLNGNGRLEYSEFRRVLKTYKFPEPEIRKVIRHLDKDVSGFIDYREFISGLATIVDSGGSGGGSSSASTSTSPGKRGSAVRTAGTRISPIKKASGLRRKPPAENGADVETLQKALLERLLATHGTVQTTFRAYDTKHTGSLTPHQFEAMVSELGFSREDASVLLASLDTDASGNIEYDEFLSRFRDTENC